MYQNIAIFDHISSVLILCRNCDWIGKKMMVPILLLPRLKKKTRNIYSPMTITRSPWWRSSLFAIIRKTCSIGLVWWWGLFAAKTILEAESVNVHTMHVENGRSSLDSSQSVAVVEEPNIAVRIARKTHGFIIVIGVAPLLESIQCTTVFSERTCPAGLWSVLDFLHSKGALSFDFTTTLIPWHTWAIQLMLTRKRFWMHDSMHPPRHRPSLFLGREEFITNRCFACGQRLFLFGATREVLSISNWDMYVGVRWKIANLSMIFLWIRTLHVLIELELEFTVAIVLLFLVFYLLLGK